MQLKENSKEAAIHWDENSFNYLAIGNSITKHGINEYWWNEIGMAATTAEKDYFHLVCEYLESNYDSVNAEAYNGASWSVQTNDRSQVLNYWDVYLSDKLDLITIQVSENVSDTTTFESDFQEMVAYIMEKCPNAQIIVIDDFWSDEKSEMKKKAIDELNAEGFDVDWIDLNEIRGKSEYQAGMGTIVYDMDGNEHIIEHSGVAVHPGDKGMVYYAERIIEKIKQKK